MSQQPQQQQGNGPKSIKVRTLVFIREMCIGDLQFKSKLSVTSDEMTRRRKLSMEYLPGLRHHAVTMTDPSSKAEGDKGPRLVTYYVPDTAVASWEPLIEA